MTNTINSRFQKVAKISFAAIISLTLIVSMAACSNSENGSANDASVIKVGTTDKLVSLDPAGSYDQGSFSVQTQVFPFLFNYDHESKKIAPDFAESGSFVSSKVFEVKLKSGLKWADGSDVTADDVKFSFDRVVAINDPNGPASLLEGLESTTVKDPLTVDFNLKNENDVIFESILTSPAGVLVPKVSFSADALTPSAEIVAKNAFGGQYVITAYEENKVVEYTKNPNYAGLYGAPSNEKVQVQYLADAANLKLGIQSGEYDVAFRTLGANDIEDLRKDEGVKVVQGAGGEERYLVFNFEIQPYGSKTDNADEKKAKAVREAIADLVDRQAIATNVYKDTYTPLYSPVPNGLVGAVSPFKDLYGDGKGGPSLEKAKAVLKENGIDDVIELKLQYNGEHYGQSSAEEYALIKDQLETSGLFKVDLQQTEWTSYNKARHDSYPVYQLGWFPDYPDADNYLSPFFGPNSFLDNKYVNKAVQEEIVASQTEKDVAARTKKIEELQVNIAKDIPTIPLLQGDQVAVVRANIEGADKTLDPSFKFNYGYLAKK